MSDTTAPPDDVLQQALALAAQLQGGQQTPLARDTTPTTRSWPSLLGSALAGAPPLPGMTDAEKEAMGRRALGDFGTAMMQASGNLAGGTIFTALGRGLAGAQQSALGSEQFIAANLGAQQAYQEKQQELRIAALKEALPLLTLAQQQKALGALKGTGTTPSGAPSGTSIGAVGAGDGTYEGAIATHEGTGANPNSTALGTGQFLASTWNNFAQANPDLFKGMTPAQILAARTDPALGAKAITWLAQENAKVLQGAGAPVSGTSLGIAHYVGAGPAARIMALPDNAPIAGIVGDAAVRANPELATMTAGQMRQRYAKVPNPAFLAASGGPKTAAVPPAPTPPAAPPAAAQALPLPPAPPEGMLPSPVAPPPPERTLGGAEGGAVVAGPAGVATVGAPRPAGPAVAGDVGAIIGGMVGAGADRATLAAGPMPSGSAAVVAGPPAANPAAAAVAQAQATNTPVEVPGGQGGWALPNGQLTAQRPTAGMPTTAPPATPAPQATTQVPPPPPVTVTPPAAAAPSRVPDTFVATPVPLPADMQDRISNPAKYIAPDLQGTLQGQITVEGATAARKAIADATDKVRADATAQGVAYQKDNAAQQHETWKVLRAEQAARETAAATRQQEERMAVINSQNTRLNAEAADQGKRNSDILTTSGNAHDAGRTMLSSIEQARTLLTGLPGSPATLMANPNMRTFLAGTLGEIDPTLATKATNADMFEAIMQRAATQISPRAPAGTERASNVNQYRAMLPSLSTSPEGRELALNFAGDLAQNQVESHNWLVQNRENPAYFNKRLGVPDYDLVQLAADKDPSMRMPRLPPMPSSFDAKTEAQSKDSKAANDRYIKSITPGQPYYSWTAGSDGRVHAVKNTWTQGADGKWTPVLGSAP